MHPVLQPNFSTPIAIVSAALWCAAAFTAMVVGPSPNNAPLAAAAPPEMVQTVRVIPISQPELTFVDRWSIAAPSSAEPAAPPSIPPAAIEEPARSMKPVKQTAAAEDRPSRHARTAHAEVRDICERHGMHKQFYHHGRYLSWRCRR